MGNLDRRIERLEGQAEPPGKVRVVGFGDIDGEHLEADIAAARAEMGPNDTLIKVVYERNWRGPDEEVT